MKIEAEERYNVQRFSIGRKDLSNKSTAKEVLKC
jgi:hypothetical protein